MRGVKFDIFRSDAEDCTGEGLTSPNRSKGKIFVVFDNAIKINLYVLRS